MNNDFSKNCKSIPGQNRWFRPLVQSWFVIFSILLGLQLQKFMLYLQGAVDDKIQIHPAAVEAYLPISSLMSLIYFLKTGIANHIHPAGLVIFSTTIILAVLIRRGFCAWVCPIGTASEWAHKFGSYLFGRNLPMPKWLDYVLRFIKYGLLAFFVYYIFMMSAVSLEQFIYGSYNRAADLKMYLFFSHISLTTLIVIAVLGILSVIFKNFLCRYLCPYGALLGIFSILSPVAIRRDQTKCTNCGLCGKECPNRIAVDKKLVVRSAECTACFRCVEVCKFAGAISMSLPKKKFQLSVITYGIITIASFLLIAQAAKACGYWQSETSNQTYKLIFENINQIGHP